MGDKGRIISCDVHGSKLKRIEEGAARLGLTSIETAASDGTCLDYYKLKETLAVGGVTNMYVIAEKLSAAGKVIKP